jgi:hypothetical protein
MMFKIRQGLTLQQSTIYPCLFSKFLLGHQVLNLTEGNHPLDAILWTSILEDSKLSGVLGASSWVILIHEKLNLIHSELSASGLSTLSIFFTLEIKGRGGVLEQRRR